MTGRSLAVFVCSLFLQGAFGELQKITAAERLNVLMIAIDDLRPELGCYGADHIKSANINRLAESGRLFNRAYCQQAVCNPSRTSLMTGMRPTSIGVTGNHVHFRSKRPNVITLSQHFKNNGYHAQSIGKIYHGVFPAGASKTTWDTLGDPQSWSVPTTRFGPRYYYTEDGITQAKQAFLTSYRPTNPAPNDWTKKLVFGPMTEAPDVSDETLYDGQVAQAAVKTLQQLNRSPDQPFFLAVGFIKPHSPFVAPKKYWDWYDEDAISLAENPDFPNDAPAFAGHGSGEIRRYTDQPKRGPFVDKGQRRLKHGYFACISYIDAQIGRVLDELDRLKLADKTVIVLFGDHGYHLGEHGLWGKTTNFELDTRVPLIVRTPGMKQPGKTTDGLAELLDIYPTLVDVCGLPKPGQLEGRSLSKTLADPLETTREAAFSQFPRGGNADTGGKNMGYSIRTDRWRYTEWIERSTGLAIAQELYDHENDPHETRNQSQEKEHASVVALLSQQIRAEFKVKKRTQPTPAQPKATDSTSFEEVAAGTFTEIKTNIGTFTAKKGHAEVDDKHRNTGKQCLHILGGENYSVEFTPNKMKKAPGRLAFQAERWTRRAPFKFRIEKLSKGKWSEIYNGDRQVVIGTFRTAVRINLDEEPIDRFRFTCTSPAKSGLLIDDIQLSPSTPQRVVAVTHEPITLPALVGTKSCPVARVRIDVEGTKFPVLLTSIDVNLNGTTSRDDIEVVSAYLTGSASTLRASGHPNCFSNAQEFGTAPPSGDTVTISSSAKLQPGANYLWLGVTLKSTANPDHVVSAKCVQLAFSDRTEHGVKNSKNSHAQRIGVAVRKQGDDGSHTYRIPGLATTNKGSLIGVYDVRRRGGGDLPGDIDVGMSRSTDGGRTWEPMRVIMDMGDDAKWNYDGIGDPAVLVDRGTGTIWVAATWSHGNRSWRGSGPGLTPNETGQLMLVRSDDDGVTWSKPINITKQVKRPEWCFLLQGPGAGITMSDGTIVFAAQYQDPPEKKRLPHSSILYSKDHGKTWHCGTGAFDDTTESQVAEIEPGVLMLNCRYNRASVRVVMTTRDMGKTWQEHPTSRQALIEPKSCMASLLAVTENNAKKNKDAKNWLLFSNPDSVAGRERITIKASNDKGLTWPKKHRLLLDAGRSAGYSCMTMIDDKTVGILYEGSLAHMTFQRIPLSDIINQPKPPTAKNESANQKR